MLLKYLFVLFLLLVLIFEGVGITFGREAAYILIICASPAFFVYMLFSKRGILFPKKAGALFISFVIVSILSSLLGLNMSNSFTHIFYLISLFFVFLIAYNHKNDLKKPVTILIFVASILFIFYYGFLNLLHLKFLNPTTGYQFVFSRIGSHNHIGDFLVLPTIICIYYLYKQKNVILALGCQFVTLPIIFISYSRSAFLSLIVTVLIMHIAFLTKIHSHTYKLIFRFAIIGLFAFAVFYLATINQTSVSHSTSKNGYNFLSLDKKLIKYKEDLGNRLIYFNQAYYSILSKPLYGIGPSNFSYASGAYTDNPYEFTESAHNIFLEILVGQGILGFIPFFLLIAHFLFKSHKGTLFYVMLGMLINFQTDYTYQIYSFLLVFFVLAGILSTEKSLKLLTAFKRNSKI